MRTKKQVLADNEDYKTLINAVINRVGMDSVSDVNNHGIAGWFNGFIYYSDTHSFAMRHRKSICQLLEETGDMLGVSEEEMVAGFGVFRGRGMDRDDKRDFRLYLGVERLRRAQLQMFWRGLHGNTFVDYLKSSNQFKTE